MEVGKELNTWKIRELMRINKDTQLELGKHLGLTRTSVNYKLAGKINFSLKELMKICQRYKVEDMNIFFK